MTCKDCIHCEICKEYARCYHEFFDENYYNGCNDFKDKSKFIELPCKAGDTVWSATTDGFIWSWIITQIRIYEDEVVIEDDSCYYYNLSDFGKTIFLTKEEAKAKIKELEK